MLTQTDIKKLQEVFPTKEDLDKKFKENNEVLIKEILELFDTTNEWIDRVLEKLDDLQGDINNHEGRISKIEEKVFATWQNKNL